MDVPLAAGVAFAAFLAYFAGMALLHFLPTGLSPLYHTVSDYAFWAGSAAWRAR